jgi:hypothetical protein
VSQCTTPDFVCSLAPVPFVGERNL